MAQARLRLAYQKPTFMWIETSREVYSVIFAKHDKELSPHASFTDGEGIFIGSGGKPEMLTEWGFKGATQPLIKAHSHKESRHDKEWNHKYYIWKHVQSDSPSED